MTQRRPTPFESYVAPARASASLWKTALGLCLIGVIYAGFLVLFVQATYPVWNLSNPTQIGTVVLLLSFGGMALGVVVVTIMLHKRAAITLFGHMPTVIRDFRVTALAVAMIFSLTLVFWAMEFDAVLHLSVGSWLVMLPFALAGIALQTGAEELVFRGYLQQQLAARFRSPIIWMIVPSVLFGFLHYDPDVTGVNLWWVVFATGMFGLAAADLTARTGSIGAAWGLHFANNVAALLILATKGSIPGLALYLTPYGIDDPVTGGIIALDLAALFVTYLLARVMLRR